MFSEYAEISTFNNATKLKGQYFVKTLLKIKKGFLSALCAYGEYASQREKSLKNLTIPAYLGPKPNIFAILDLYSI